MKNLLLALTCYLLLSCENGPKNGTAQTIPVTVEDSVNTDTILEEEASEKYVPPPSHNFPYHLDRPDATFTLPDRLAEISALSMSSDEKYLLVVNDEQGKVFYLDKNSGDLIEEIKFNGIGDYEGVEMVGEKIYVVKSNGKIYEVQNPGKKNQDTKTLKTNLGTANDVEGLGYDADQDYLLLACKGKAGDGDKFKRYRAVYAFDLKKEKLLKDPLFLIGRDEIKKWADDGRSDVSKQLTEFFQPGLAGDAFAPSGIAVHPETKELYILSSVGKILLVLNTSGKIAHIEPLDGAIHKQPEGLCFDADGTLFISTEGRGGKGKVYRFNSI